MAGIFKTVRETGVNKPQESAEKSIFRLSNTPALSINLWAGGLEADRMLKDPQRLRVERRPETVIRDVCRRLQTEGYTPKAWDQLDVQGRKNMLRNVLELMSQEMLIPKELRSRMKLQFEPMGSTNGSTNKFVAAMGNSNQFSLVHNPVITMNETNLTSSSCIENLGTLFHETIHVMQQVSSIENVPWTENIAYWKANLENYGSFKSWAEYATGPLEAYAHANTSLFKRVFQSMNADYLVRRPSVYQELAFYPPEHEKYKQLEWKYRQRQYTYTRQANQLETDIKRKIQPPSMDREVKRLRTIAEEAKKKADYYQKLRSTYYEG